MTVTELAERLLGRHEGRRLRPYLCPSGKLTIGFGRNLTDKGITGVEAKMLLEGDIRVAIIHLSNDQRTREIYKSLDSARQVVLIDMSVNLGFVGLLGFKLMWAALGKGDYDAAAGEMLDSVYARQLPARSNRLAGIMRNPEMLLEALEGDDA